MFREDVTSVVRIALLLAYIVVGIVCSFAGYWWGYAFILGSPLIAIFISMHRRERWPVSDDLLGIFFWYPAFLYMMSGPLFSILGLRASHILDFVPWLIASSLMSAALTVALFIAGRRDARPKHAIAATLATAFCFAMAILDAVNVGVDWHSPKIEQAFVKESWPGGARSGPPTLILYPVGPYKSETTQAVSFEAFQADRAGKPLSVGVCRRVGFALERGL
jgi:hypothetical protein